MASVKVAVRVRPFNQRELDLQAKLIIQMEGKKTRIYNNKVIGVKEGDQHRERTKDFTFDHSYWSYEPDDPHFASQEEVFNDLGTDVVDSAFQGYNACVFAYGQTGSGKTFTMMGSQDCQGLIPRICKTMFERMAAGKEAGASYRTEVSYLEIYNEKVKDLLVQDSSHSLRVREHPTLGPYVQQLSKHLVSDYAGIQEWMSRGNQHRTTARTNMNDTSSRSHAIFTITFVQAEFSRNLPSETVSKVHLVDLAGSERADATGATGERLKEGAHINKSLVTLGLVISTLAKLSGSPHDGHMAKRSSSFIPYRDSVLTWLLKDSLGGNSKTIMIAAVSPADVNYEETLSTLRYANRAKNIINKPTINEDPNVTLIRTLREEINKLKTLLCDQLALEPNVLAQLQQKEAREKELTEEWTEKWRETRQILQEQCALGLRKSGVGIILDSDRPHLVGIYDDLLSTGVTFYHLKDGETLIGTEEASIKQDIELSGGEIEPEHCSVVLHDGVAWLHPRPKAQCWVNTVPVDKPVRLGQGCIILLGRTNMFRFNDPAEAAVLRKGGSRSHLNLSTLSLLYSSSSDLTGSRDKNYSAENLSSTSFQEEESNGGSGSWDEKREQMETVETQHRTLYQERKDMESDYQAQREKLAADWECLERRQNECLASLSEREEALHHRREELELEREEERISMEKALAELADAQLEVDEKRRVLDQMLLNEKHSESDSVRLGAGAVPSLKSLAAECCSPGSDLGLTTSDSWTGLLMEVDHTTSSTSTNHNHKDEILDLMEQHKKELVALELELQTKMLAINERRAKIDQLSSELSELEGWAEEKRAVMRQLSGRSVEELQVVRERKEALSLELRSKACPEGAAKVTSDTSDTSDTGLVTCDTFHTALSPPEAFSALGDKLMSDSGVGLTGGSGQNGTMTFHDAVADKTDLQSERQINGAVATARLQADKRRGRGSDSSDEEWGKRQPLRLTRQLSKSCRTICDDVGVSEAMRALKQLCQKVAAHKVLIMQSLENDCGKEELNKQIAELQDLQLQYVRLEAALELRREGDESGRGRQHGSCDATPIRHYPDSPMSPVVFPAVLSEGSSPYTCSMARSMPSLRTGLDDEGCDPCNPSDSWVRIPSFVLRGAGRSTRYEYELRLCTDGEKWTLMRRYRRFRELHLTMKAKYGAQVDRLNFPPRQWLPINSENLARRRRSLLETYLRQLIDTCSRIRGCPLYSCQSAPTRLELIQFSPFFRKGIFETGKYGTS